MKLCWYKVPKKIPYIIAPPPTVWSVIISQDGSILSCHLHQILTFPFKGGSRNVQTTRFSLFLLHEPFLLLFLAEAVAHKGIFSCCSPSASWVDVMCIQRCFYAHLGCHMWLFELLAWSTLTILFWPLPPTRHFRPLNGHFLFFEPFTAKHRNDCVGKSQEISNC